MNTIAPFANESQSLNVGELTIENRSDRVSLYGNLDFTKDKAGLEHARTLKAILGSIVRALETERSLPERIRDGPKPEQVKNPFR